MAWLTEDPTLVVTLGAMTLALLAIALFKTGRAVLLVVMVGVVAVAGLLVLAERWIVTDREEVEEVLDDVVDALGRNDAEAVLRRIAPDAESVRQRAAFVLRMVTLEQIRTTKGPEITIHTLTSPKRADVEMVVIAKGRLRVGSTGHNHHAAEVHLTLRHEQDRWWIETAETKAPFGR